MFGTADEDWGLARATPLFADLPDDVLARLLARARVLEAGRGRMLFLRGDPADRFYVVLEGWVKVFVDKPDGAETVLHVMKKGEALAHPAVILGKPYPASAEVVSEARLLEVPGAPFLDVLRDHAELSLRLVASLSQRLVAMVGHIEQLQARSTAERLAAFLLELCVDRHGHLPDGPVSIPLPYDKSLIAARLGMKPESFSRALSALKPHGVTRDRSAVAIADPARLRAFVASSDAG